LDFGLWTLDFGLFWGLIAWKATPRDEKSGA
jgi:hypothetical protein